MWSWDKSLVISAFPAFAIVSITRYDRELYLSTGFKEQLTDESWQVLFLVGAIGRDSTHQESLEIRKEDLYLRRTLFSQNCPCRLCENHIHKVGFANIH